MIGLSSVRQISGGWRTLRLSECGCPTRRLAGGGFQPSSEPGSSHDAVGANATSPQIRSRISRISSSSWKQLWVGRVFFRLGTLRLQELVEAKEFAAEGAGVGGPLRFARVDGECGSGG